MKNLLFVFFFISLEAFPQKDLGTNPFFLKYASKTILYPKQAVRYGLFGRIYAEFDVNAVGKIQNVTVIYPIMDADFEKKVGFKENIQDGLMKIPLLGHNYEGHYLLPIAFCYQNRYEVPAISEPTNVIPKNFSISYYTLLPELKIIGDGEKYPEYLPFSKIPKKGKQIIE